MLSRGNQTFVKFFQSRGRYEFFSLLRGVSVSTRIIGRGAVRRSAVTATIAASRGIARSTVSRSATVTATIAAMRRIPRRRVTIAASRRITVGCGCGRGGSVLVLTPRHLDLLVAHLEAVVDEDGARGMLVRRVDYKGKALLIDPHLCNGANRSKLLQIDKLVSIEVEF